MRFSIFKTVHGFTFFEVVAVLLLIGLFTTVAIIQHANTDPTLIVQSQILQSHIRYAQMRSINNDVPWGIEYHYSAGSPPVCHYELYWQSPGNVVTLPGESAQGVDLCDKGITIAWDIGGVLTGQAFELSFDSWGRPHLGGQPVTSNNIDVNMSKAGHTSRQWTITKNTGFIR